MDSKRSRIRRRKARFEQLEHRRLLTRSSHVPLEEISETVAEYRVARADFEQQLAEIALEGVDYSEVVYRAVLEAGALPDTPAQRVDPNVGGRFGGVGSLEVANSSGGFTICTGSVIDNTHVLTAAHCFDADNNGALDALLNTTFILNNGGSRTASITVRDVAIHPDFGGFTTSGANDDLAVLTLATPVPAGTPQHSVRGSAMSTGETVELVGYGASGHGNVVGGEVPPDVTVKRTGMNQVDLLVVDDEGSGNHEIFIYDFDGPTGDGLLGGPTLGNAVETVVRGGDSGSPAFIGGVIAGVNTFEFSLTNTGSPGEFGALGGGVIIGAAQAAWIASVSSTTVPDVPDPDAGSNFPRVNISTTATSLREGGSSVLATISRTGDLRSSLTVQYEVGGTASKSDYAGLSGIAIIPAGQSQTSIGILAVDDGLSEPTETILITILPDVSYRVGASPVVALSIIDNDGQPNVDPPQGPNVATVSIITKSTVIDEGSLGFRVTFARDGAFDSNLRVHYTVGGSAKSGIDYRPLSGTATIPAGTPFAHVDIIPIDDSLSEDTESVSISLVPDSAYKIGAVPSTIISITDNEPPLNGPLLPVVEITPSGATIDEGSSGTQFTITRTGDLRLPLTVAYAIGGSASPGSDYSALSGIATIPAGNASVQVQISPNDDDNDEADETIVISLKPNVNYAVGPHSTSTFLILDNDQPNDNQNPTANLPFVSIITDPTSTLEGSDGVRVTFARTGSLITSLVVRYSATGTASAGTDYATLSGIAVIPAGTPFVNVMVVPFRDAQNEPTETVVISVTPDPGYNVGTVARTTIQIIDNNAAVNDGNDEADEATPTLPKVSVVANVSSVNEGSTGTRYTIARDGNLNTSLAVHYSVRGTATSGSDYVPLSGVAIIPAGVPFVHVDLVPRDDNLAEGDESVTLSITSTSNYSLSSSSTATVTIIDNDGGPADGGDGGSGDAGGDGGGDPGDGGGGDVGEGEPAETGEFLAQAESTLSGTKASGSLSNTYVSDNQYEVLQEASVSPTLNHLWTFDIPAGGAATFSIEAHHTSSTDTFWVNYSANGGRTWVTMMSISKTADDGQAQTFKLPDGISGEVLVQMKDSHRFGDDVFDRVFIDKISIDVV